MKEPNIWDSGFHAILDHYCSIPSRIHKISKTFDIDIHQRVDESLTPFFELMARVDTILDNQLDANSRQQIKKSIIGYLDDKQSETLEALGDKRIEDLSSFLFYENLSLEDRSRIRLVVDTIFQLDDEIKTTSSVSKLYQSTRAEWKKSAELISILLWDASSKEFNDFLAWFSGINNCFDTLIDINLDYEAHQVSIKPWPYFYIYFIWSLIVDTLKNLNHVVHTKRVWIITKSIKKCIVSAISNLHNNKQLLRKQ